MNQQNNQNNQNNGGPGGKKNRQSLLIIMLGILGALMIWNFVTTMSNSAAKDEEITYSQFLTMLDNNEVKSVELQSDKLTITPREQKYKNITVTYTATLMEDSTALVERLSKIACAFSHSATLAWPWRILLYLISASSEALAALRA